MTTPIQRARAKYDAEKRHTKKVTFNKETEAHLIEAAESIESFSVLVKEKLAEYLSEKNEQKYCIILRQ